MARRGYGSPASRRERAPKSSIAYTSRPQTPAQISLDPSSRFRASSSPRDGDNDGDGPCDAEEQPPRWKCHLVRRVVHKQWRKVVGFMHIHPCTFLKLYCYFIRQGIILYFYF